MRRRSMIHRSSRSRSAQRSRSRSRSPMRPVQAGAIAASSAEGAGQQRLIATYVETAEADSTTRQQHESLGPTPRAEIATGTPALALSFPSVALLLGSNEANSSSSQEHTSGTPRTDDSGEPEGQEEAPHVPAEPGS